MLQYSNKNDITKMYNYHRTSDMIKLLHLFPKISPIKDLTIVLDFEDYLNNKLYLNTLTTYRNDTIKQKNSMSSLESTGFANDYGKIIKEIKTKDKDGVLVLFNLINKPSHRYERYAGISISVSVGKGIFIEAVGKGFDGREVSKGIDTHERYYINWFDLRLLNVAKLKKYRTFIIKDNDYINSRNKRIDFLKSVGIKDINFDKYIPVNYYEIPNFIWEDIIVNILNKLEKMEEELICYKLTEFSISGHTEGKKYMPWQIFDKTRYIK